jgi:thiamine-phosphate diphosphorylase
LVPSASLDLIGAMVLQLDALRVLLVTDGRGDVDRLRDLVQAAVAGGVRAVQLREPNLAARRLAELASELLPLLVDVGGYLLVNDRVDVAAAGHAHGAQVGHRSLSPRDARTALGASRLLGCSVHDERQLADAASAGADFAVLAPVFATASKPGVEPLGMERAGRCTAAAQVPVLWLGGVTPANVARIVSLPRDHRPCGVAVLGGICHAVDPRAAAAQYCEVAAALGSGTH